MENNLNFEETMKELEKVVQALENGELNLDESIKEFEKGKTVGGISELYDSKSPYESKGAFTQAWSVAEIFRIILKGKQTNENFRN